MRPTAVSQTVREPGSAPSAMWVVGDIVRHERYGEGCIGRIFYHPVIQPSPIYLIRWRRPNTDKVLSGWYVQDMSGNVGECLAEMKEVG